MNQTLILETAKKLNYPTPLPIAKEIIEFTGGNKKHIDKIIDRITKNEPWEYIRGYTYFLEYKIYVNRKVLIPRKETENLVTVAVQNIQELNEKEIQIVDVGTGSGCIAIALEKLLQKDIIAIDTSIAALEVAKENAKENSCTKIRFYHSEFENLKIKHEKPIVIVANLPYIPQKDIPLLEDSVKEYEPLEALDGGVDGAQHYLKLLVDIEEKNIPLEMAMFEIDTKMVKPLLKKLEFGKRYKYSILNDEFQKKRFLIIKKR